jgi:hypothetical protein
MGLDFSSLLASITEDNTQTGENGSSNATFVVPSYHSFSINQLDQMIQAGQQPGVPFRIADGAVERPQRERRKIKIVDLDVSIMKHSIKLTFLQNGKFSISFYYTARKNGICIIYLSALNSTNIKTLRFTDIITFILPKSLTYIYIYIYLKCISREKENRPFHTEQRR